MLCYLLAGYVTVTSSWYVFWELETTSFSKLAAIYTAVILPWFLQFSQECAVFFTIFAVIFYCPGYWEGSIKPPAIQLGGLEERCKVPSEFGAEPLLQMNFEQRTNNPENVSTGH